MAKPSIKQGIKEDIGLWTKGFKGGVGWAIPFPGPKKIKIGARVVAGITGKGARAVTKVYRNMGK